MLDKILPKDMKAAINNLPYDKLNEIRLRVGKRVIVRVCGKSYYLSDNGIQSGTYLVCTRSMIDNIITSASEHSLYAINNQLKQGYITVEGGIRIGISGEMVVDNNMTRTIKNITSLNIRIPHEVKNCSLSVLKYIISDKFYNTLVISPPGCGKTTLIRDIVYQMSSNGYCYNVLIVDERFEIANGVAGELSLDVGDFADVISGSTKAYGLENGIRSMSPDIVVTDEISTEKDIKSIESASSCGVGVIASVHCDSIEGLKHKPYFDTLIENKVFRRYILLSNENGPGSVVGVYDENMRGIYY